MSTIFMITSTSDEHVCLPILLKQLYSIPSKNSAQFNKIPSSPKQPKESKDAFLFSNETLKLYYIHYLRNP